MPKQEIQINETIKEFSEKLPKFPDGRINYSHSDKAPVLNCFVKFGDRVLILKRSDKVGAYKGKWNSVAGYLDEPKPVREKVLEELKEELGILKNDILSVKMGEPYEFFDDSIKKTWIIHPVLVELKQKPKIKLDWEHTDFKWIAPEELLDYDIVTKLDESLKRVLK